VITPNKSCLLAACSLWALWGCSPAPPPRAAAAVQERLLPVARLFPHFEIALDPANPEARLFVVDQGNVDVQLQLVRPSGDPREFDAPARRATPERLCVGSNSGFTALRISTREPLAESSLQFRLIESAFDGDAAIAQVECEAVTSETAGNHAQESVEKKSLGQASDFRSAAELWSAGQRSTRAGDAFLNAAWMRARFTSDNAGALADGYAARTQYEAAKDATGVARSALVIAVARWALIEGGQVEAGALASREAMLRATQQDLERAVETFDSANVPFFAAESRNHLANSYYEQGRYAEAMRLFAEAASRFASAGVREGEVRARANFNSVLRQVGNFSQASEAFARLLGERGADTTDQVLADILDGSAGTHSVVGDHDKALPQFVQALQIHERFGDRPGMARSLNGLAATYTRLGVPAAALEYAKQARAVMREREMDRGPGTETVEFTSELLAGNAQRALGELLEAEASHRTALAYARNDPARLQARIELVRDLLSAGNADAANAEIAAAQPLASAGLEIQRLQLALEKARAQLLAERPRDLRQDLEKLERNFAALGTREFQLDALQTLTSLEFRRGRLDAALESNGRTLEVLNSLRLALSNPELRVRLTSLHRRAYESRVDILLAQRERSATTTHRSELLRQIFAAADQARAGLVHESAQARALVSNAAEGAQLRAVAAEIALREHVLAAVDSGGITGVSREKLRAELSTRRAQADVLGAPTVARPSFAASEYEAGRMRPDTAILLFVQSGQTTQRFLVTRGSTVEWREANDPAAVAGYPHLILVGVPVTEDPLMAALTTDHDVTMALTLHDALRIAELPDESRRPNLARVAIFFDPVFTPYDVRVGHAPPPTAAFPVKPRLSATRREADFINWQLRSSRVDRFTSFNARREDALSERASGATVLHFATHAIASDQWPNGSGLLLSSFSSNGDPLNGFLSTLDLLTQRAKTDLVVLSACDTARGDTAAGENVAGLARAFLGGGARRVVASLRKVDDSDTARFMNEFYRRLAAGETPAAALADSRRALASAGADAPLDFVLYERAPDS